MRVGIFGGSFDPVHQGHLILAEQCREQSRLDQVWFVPSATAPHKPQGPTAVDRQRLEMLQLAIAGHEAFRINEIEMNRGGTSYTVDTLQALRAQFPENLWFLILGSDSLNQLSSWREPAHICELADLLVYQRPNAPSDWEPLRGLVPRDRWLELQALQFEARMIDISSTDLRDRIRRGLSIRYLVPRSVEKYIEHNRLYQT